MASPLDEEILRLLRILPQEPDVFPLQQDFPCLDSICAAVVLFLHPVWILVVKRIPDVSLIRTSFEEFMNDLIRTKRFCR